jgi:hypothetical protein
MHWHHKQSGSEQTAHLSLNLFTTGARSSWRFGGGHVYHSPNLLAAACMETAAKTVGGSSHWDLQRRSQCIGEPRNFWENKPQWWWSTGSAYQRCPDPQLQICPHIHKGDMQRQRQQQPRRALSLMGRIPRPGRGSCRQQRQRCCNRHKPFCRSKGLACHAVA